jgi:hypothetical protein
MMPGNPIVGDTVLRRPAIQSPNFVTGVSGWTINIDGSAEFNNLSIRGTFNGTNFVINSSGEFFYSGTPASGNLIQSVTNGAGTDGVGNAYLTGTTVYSQVGGTFIATSLEAGTVAWFTASSAAGPYTQQTDIGFSWNNVTGGSLLLQATDKVKLGQGGNAIWDEIGQQFNLPSGGGPFISGESFHAVSNGTGVSGTARVKKLPWNAIWLDVECTFTYTGAAQTFTMGSLPDATYYPTAARHFPVGITGTPSGIATTSPRMFVPTSGALQFLVPSGAGAGAAISASVIYPTN